MSKNWWNLDVQDVVEELKTDLTNGLSDHEAKLRLEKYGRNQLEEKKGHGPLTIFLAQFKDFIIWVLIGAAVVSGLLKEWIDALAIIAIVILNAIMGFIQEYRAEKALSALKKLASPTSKIIRQSEHKVVPSSELVPGDLIELEAGDNVPADARIISMTPNFATQEASLTGESNPVIKTIKSLVDEHISLGDRVNMVFMGTSVTAGKSRAVITETGMKTELGKIAGLIQEIDQESTPLQKKLEQFGKRLVYASFAIVGIVFLLGILRGEKILDMFLTAVSLAVAAIPEGLPAVVTIALTLGVQRMVKRHTLVRKLPSVETLGSATVICSDKTGTLTKNEMTVQEIYTDNNFFRVTGIGYQPEGEFLINDKPINYNDYPSLHKTLLCGILCNGAELVNNNGSYKIIGDPTEGAILTCAAKAGLWKKDLEKDYTFVEEIPFDSERKKMTIIRNNSGKKIAYVKGAPDILLENCSKIDENGKVRNLNDEDRKKILQANNDLANKAMRVLAVAYREFDEEPIKYEPFFIERDLVFVGLIAMIDPPREEVKSAIKMCETAGIKTIMITGDHKNTAAAIAKELGFFKENSVALTGSELDNMNDEDFDRNIDRIPVYARVSPENKLRIVRFWKKRNEIVAMTGDGINDAPAVKEADIGVAMGITGTDVTKEVSEMIVTDDNFASIVAAIEEGRGIYENIKKFIYYLLSCNVGEILVMFLSSLFGMPIPLLPIHLLWINLITDGLPALALGVDPVDPDIMKRQPRKPNEPIVTKHGALLILSQGVFIALCTLVAFGFVLVTEGDGLFVKVDNQGLRQARTVAFVVLVCSELIRSLAFRNLSGSAFKVGIFKNRKLVYAILASLILQISIVYIPIFRPVFKIAELTLNDWLIIIVVSSLPFWGMELMKVTKKMEI